MTIVTNGERGKQQRSWPVMGPREAVRIVAMIFAFCAAIVLAAALLLFFVFTVAS